MHRSFGCACQRHVTRPQRSFEIALRTRVIPTMVRGARIGRAALIAQKQAVVAAEALVVGHAPASANIVPPS